MDRVYFDRNVFSALSELEGDITAADVEKIKLAVESSAISILGSRPLFEETVTTISKSENMYRRHMATTLALIDKHRMIKPMDKLVLDDCYAYAVGLPEIDRTTTFPARLKVFLNATESKSRLLEFAEAIKSGRGGSAAGLTEGLLLARAEGVRKKVGDPDDFDEIWNGVGEVAVTYWVDQCPREIKKKCYKRGIKKMLQIKSLRFFSLYYMSLVHTGWFGVTGDPRKVKHGDIGDMFHAISASAANIFVTGESKIKRGHLGHILSLKPTPGFEVLDLKEFLTRI